MAGFFILDGIATRSLVRQKGFKQFQVAKRLRLSPPFFCQILQGDFPINRPTLAALAVILGVPAAKLIAREGSHHAA